MHTTVQVLQYAEWDETFRKVNLNCKALSLVTMAGMTWVLCISLKDEPMYLNANHLIAIQP